MRSSPIWIASSTKPTCGARTAPYVATGVAGHVVVTALSRDRPKWTITIASAADDRITTGPRPSSSQDAIRSRKVSTMANKHSLHTVVSLPNAATLALRARRREGVLVTCTSGTCWVTEEGVFHDFILQCGDAYQARKGSLVVVCALSDSVLSTEESEPRPRARAA
jgi:Protein of unknown function (DUF2917)